MKLFLFDVDQTLISTGGAGLRALNRACQKLLSIENAVDGISPHGKTDPAIIREILIARAGSDSNIESHLQAILESYLTFLREEVHLSEMYRVLPGILGVLQEISTRANAILGLATGNIELGARVKLERGDLNRYFKFGGFGSDSESRPALVRIAAEQGGKACGRPIEPKDVFVIGDTPRDIEAGRAAGFTTVGVATGSYSVNQLRVCGADITVSDFHQDRDYFFRSTFME